MYIHCQSWSDPLFWETLAAQELPNDGRLVKVFATEEDPRAALDRPELTVIEGNPDPLSEEDYYFPDRGSYQGRDLESWLADTGLRAEGVAVARTLFRFSYEHGFCQDAMAARVKGDWLIQYPLDEIRGMNLAVRNARRQRFMHLNVFFPTSLKRLQAVVNFEDPTRVLDKNEGVSFLNKWHLEG